MTLAVWSERYDPFAPGGAFRDCTQSSYLDTLLYGGAPIPNAYTVAERERFEDNEGLPEYVAGAPAGTVQETGLFGYSRCDIAAQKLYGVAAHDAPEADLPTLLNTPGIALALTGEGAGLPSGYQGAHSVCFVPIGNNSVWVYDPLAVMGSAPTNATVAAILAWHRRLPYDIRVVHSGEFMARNFSVRSWSPVHATIKADSAHYGVPIDGRTTWPLLTAGDVYEGLPIKLDVAIPGGLAGEDRVDGTLVMVGSVACIVLDKDADLVPTVVAADASFLVHLNITGGVPSISLA